MSVTLERDGKLWTLEPAGNGHQWIGPTGHLTGHSPSGKKGGQMLVEIEEPSRAGMPTFDCKPAHDPKALAGQLRAQASIMSAASPWGSDLLGTLLFAAADALDSKYDAKPEYSSDPISLQKRLDELALRLTGADRETIYEARSAIWRGEERLAVIRQAVG